MFVTQFFGGTLAVAGLAILLLERNAAKKLENAQNWPVAHGTITISKIKGGEGSKGSFHTKIKYQYLVDGREFEGKRISLGGDVSGSRNRAQERAEIYPEGTPVTVYYNPNNPKDAFLELEHDGKQHSSVIGVSSIIIGLSFATGIWPPS